MSALLLAPASGALQGPGCPQFAGQTLCIPLDTSFTEVAFVSTNCGRNDDGSALLSLTQWDFDFYGTPWGEIYVNNNGNVSFGVPFSNFSASGFPVANFPMVAPFWADVDTREDSGFDGVVWYREWSTESGDSVNRLVVTWDSVGYFN
ncbi:MAG: nidogen-like domain-containing protein, partial [Planctomycetota bacterium]